MVLTLDILSDQMHTLDDLVSVRPCSSVGRVTVDLIRRSWVRSSSETQGHSGDGEKSKTGERNIRAKKNQERAEKPLGTMSAFHSTKISGLRLENFLVSNGSQQVRNGLVPFHSQNEFRAN